MLQPLRPASLALLTLAVLLPACSRSLPRGTAQTSLYRDVQRLVTLRSAAGWQIDRFEIEAMLPDVLMSLCQVAPADRQALMTWLDGRIRALGGPIETAYRARGKDLDAVDTLLEVTRIRKTLATAMATAEADCPFWLEPDPDFSGRQSSDDRWQVSAGGGGKGIIVSQEGQSDLNFGGAGRALLGRNLGLHWAIYSGLEAGGSAGFAKGEQGDRSNLLFAADLVAPVVVRYRLINAYWEFEAGYLAHVTEDDWTDIAHGFHVGAAFGGRTARVRWFFPGAALGISYERTYEDEGILDTFKVGFRAAFDLDL